MRTKHVFPTDETGGGLLPCDWLERRNRECEKCRTIFQEYILKRQVFCRFNFFNRWWKENWPGSIYFQVKKAKNVKWWSPKSLVASCRQLLLKKLWFNEKFWEGTLIHLHFYLERNKGRKIAFLFFHCFLGRGRGGNRSWASKEQFSPQTFALSQSCFLPWEMGRALSPMRSVTFIKSSCAIIVLVNISPESFFQTLWVIGYFIQRTDRPGWSRW